MKKILVIIFIALCALLFGIFFYARINNPPRSQSVNRPTPTLGSVNPNDGAPLPVATIQNTQLKVDFSFQVTSLPTPETLPTYTIGNQDNVLRKANVVAQKFGFTQQPTEIKGIDTTIRSWKTDTTAFSIKTPPVTLSFLQNTPLSGPLPSKETAQIKLTEFFHNYSIIDPSVALLPLETKLLTAEGNTVLPATSSATANMIYTSYRYTLDGYPLYLQTNTTTDISGMVGPNGTVRSAVVTLLPTLVLQGKKAVIPFGVAAQTLVNNKGVLIAVEKDRISEVSFAPSFSRATITNSSLGYVWLKNNTVVPIYLFFGVAQGQDVTSRGAHVTYMVAATQ